MCERTLTSRLVGVYFLYSPKTHMPYFLHDAMLCNDTCSVTRRGGGGGITLDGGGGWWG